MQDEVTDDDFLDDGKVPAFVENCQHERMDKAPASANFVRISACKDCGQLMIGSRKKWDIGRGIVSLPVTMEKIQLQMLSNAFSFNPRENGYR